MRIVDVAVTRTDYRAPDCAVIAPDIDASRATQSPEVSPDSPTSQPCPHTPARQKGYAVRGWPDDIVRQLENWAMWCANGRKPVSLISPYPAYRMAARGKRAGNVIPILSIDAEKADKIISDMQPRWAQPLRMHYLWELRSERSRALACNCALDTYKKRLDEAHTLFAQCWYVKGSLSKMEDAHG